MVCSIVLHEMQFLNLKGLIVYLIELYVLKLCKLYLMQILKDINLSEVKNYDNAINMP